LDRVVSAGELVRVVVGVVGGAIRADNLRDAVRCVRGEGVLGKDGVVRLAVGEGFQAVQDIVSVLRLGNLRGAVDVPSRRLSKSSSSG
jgi:hypothetical protein